jgi:hypothetical protein
MDPRRDRHLGPCCPLGDALTGHRPAAVAGDGEMSQTCDRCGPAVGAAYRADRIGELCLCDAARAGHGRRWPRGAGPSGLWACMRSRRKGPGCMPPTAPGTPRSAPQGRRTPKHQHPRRRLRALDCLPGSVTVGDSISGRPAGYHRLGAADRRGLSARVRAQIVRLCRPDGCLLLRWLSSAGGGSASVRLRRVSVRRSGLLQAWAQTRPGSLAGSS